MTSDIVASGTPADYAGRSRIFQEFEFLCAKLPGVVEDYTKVVEGILPSGHPRVFPHYRGLIAGPHRFRDPIGIVTFSVEGDSRDVTEVPVSVRFDTDSTTFTFGKSYQAAAAEIAANLAPAGAPTQA